MFNTEFFAKTFFLALSGIPTTLNITAVSLLIAVPLAFFMALSRIYRVPMARQAVTLYVSFVRGTPLILQILIVYSLVPSLLAAFFKEIGSSYNIFDLNPIVYGYTVFSLNTAALLTEVFRSALLTVDKGQLEAAHSIGIGTVRAYTRIILPQALVVALPNLANTTITLIKSTSLAFMMTIKEITALAKLEANYGYNYIEAYLDIWIVYILLCSAIEFLFRWAEKAMKVYKSGKTGSVRKNSRKEAVSHAEG
ncbi:amino acid ABC transporter permease [Oscillospiraceae bacterium MB08-C2-2]|nr:amino acid ABC transporter permease [Oscillospiraceae bacterium MB08-C2-2]